MTVRKIIEYKSCNSYFYTYVSVLNSIKVCRFLVHLCENITTAIAVMIKANRPSCQCTRGITLLTKNVLPFDLITFFSFLSLFPSHLISDLFGFVLLYLAGHS